MIKKADRPAVAAVCAKVKALREEREWSQSNLATNAQLPIGTIKSIERGREPGFTKIVKLSAAFGVSTEVFSDEANPLLPALTSVLT